ncbi:MAG: hydrogenase/urease maturation nickel metallochaperone HypA [Patescibacteria group bacterium]|jgi:Zn finger protein HypA/HybF involved in hydrogenase expression
MHDLHVADKIIKLALQYAEKNKLKKITVISVELGTVVEHGEEINPDNLKFNMNLLAKDTMAENAKIIIGKIKGESWNLKEIEGE